MPLLCLIRRFIGTCGSGERWHEVVHESNLPQQSQFGTRNSSLSSNTKIGRKKLPSPWKVTFVRLTVTSASIFLPLEANYSPPETPSRRPHITLFGSNVLFFMFSVFFMFFIFLRSAYFLVFIFFMFVTFHLCDRILLVAEYEYGEEPPMSQTNNLCRF